MCSGTVCLALLPSLLNWKLILEHVSVKWATSSNDSISCAQCPLYLLNFPPLFSAAALNK